MQRWIVCSAVFSERRLFYLINRQEGELMAVYQSCVADIRRFIRLKTGSNSIELIALISDGALRRYLFPGIPVQVAKFDGAAGLLTSFPVCEFETCQWRYHLIKFIPFQMVDYGAARHFDCQNDWKYSIEQTRDLSPQRLSGFALFPMSRKAEMFVLQWLESIRTSGGSQWTWLTVVTCPWLPKFIWDAKDP